MGISTHATRYMYRESKGDKWIWVPGISCLGTPIQVCLRVHVLVDPYLYTGQVPDGNPTCFGRLVYNECHIYTSIAPSQALGLQGTSPGLFEGCCIWMELTMVEHNHGDPRQCQGDFRGGSQLCAPQIHQTSAVGARWTKDNSEKFPYQVRLILEVSPSWGQKFPQVVIFFCKDGPSSCSCYIALGCSWRN